MKTLPVIKVPDDQREWLDRNKEKTGDSISTVIRRFLQQQVNKDKRKK